MHSFNKITIFYFSGTGNSKNVAKWLCNEAEKNEIQVDLFDISKIKRRGYIKPSNDSLIVFISPVHGFNYPPVMLKFIFHFSKGDNKIILMNTRAGMLIGKWITPGLSGITFYLSGLILLVKGYKLKGFIPFDLPSNWISIHPGLNEKTIRFITCKIKEKVTVTSQRIILGKSDFRSFQEIIQDILVAPISFLYYFVGRFFLAKTYVASSSCDNCKACIKNCPVKAIIEIDNRPFWTYKCESCMKCMGNCPQKAIETIHGFATGIIVLYSTFIAVLLGKFYKQLPVPVENEIIKFIIETTVWLGMVFTGYRIVHYLMRFKYFEKIFIYTSLTKYKFWGKRYKAV